MSDDLEYVNNANQKAPEFKNIIFTGSKQIGAVDFCEMNLFRIKNFIRDKRWDSLNGIKDTSLHKNKTQDWLYVYECSKPDSSKWIVVILDMVELSENPYSIIVEPI